MHWLLKTKHVEKAGHDRSKYFHVPSAAAILWYAVVISNPIDS